MMPFHEIIGKNTSRLLDQILVARKLVQNYDNDTYKLSIFIDEKETISIEQIDNSRISRSTSENIFVCEVEYKELQPDKDIYIDYLRNELKDSRGVLISFETNYSRYSKSAFLDDVLNMLDGDVQKPFNEAMEKTVEKLFEEKEKEEYLLKIVERINDIKYCYKQQSKKEAK
jgi:hypothetical protein